jgi:hypothetical protein
MTKGAKDLTREELERIVDTVKEKLWLNDEGIWDVDTPWDWNRIETIAEVMADLGMRPDTGSET